MSSLTRNQVKDLIAKTQERYTAIQHEQWDAKRGVYRTHDTAMWQQAVKETVPWLQSDWREIIRVLAQGESYYGGRY